ncbi:response regulator [Mucilaginibacter sp. ZT4R22]|uniref:Response regulator n=1 Tax=Mucilaginibacter pankratovii TaxID=2772110 RepID=A0ABR7WWW4_9SPHI|nr:response regulator [Mucilaginibacter pankratovii]MBD1366788.1 response regulator [Mucilaginibacter pankratovii]
MSVERQNVTACIIDDDDIFIYGFKKFIEIRGVFAEILHFSNGQEAIDYLKNPFYADNLPDIIFVDINMPVMDGWEFTRKFEEIKSRMGKKICVYAISSSVDINDINRAKNNPVIEDYILKPISETYIADIINSCQISPGFSNMN